MAILRKLRERLLPPQPDVLVAPDVAVAGRGEVPSSNRYRNLLAEVVALDTQQRYADALRIIRIALAEDPDNLALQFAGASVLMDWGRLREAAEGLRRAAASGHSHPSLFLQLAAAYSKLGMAGEGEACARKAIVVDPDSANAYFVLGNALRDQQRYEEAIASYDMALSRTPGDAGSQINAANCHLERKEYGLAEAYLRRAIEVDASNGIAWSVMGVVLDCQDRHDEAIGALERSNRLYTALGKEAEVAANLAVILVRDGRVEEALDVYRAAVQKAPVSRCLYGYGEAQLLAGQFAEGWANYEFRWLQEPWLSTRLRLRARKWTGQDISGKRILLAAEQGLGDTLQFVRYAREVKRLGATVVLYLNPALRGLVDTVPGADEVAFGDEPVPATDYYVCLMSLPHVFGTDLKSIPSDIPYLTPNAVRVERWRNRLGDDGMARVGLVWAGNPEHARDRYRSIPVDKMNALSDAERVRFFSLQKAQKGQPEMQLPMDLAVENLGPELNDFADTAAVISQLDLVICVDTAVAHLAGGLGANVWLLLPEPCEWRWLRGRDDSPWYPTMRLFRQRQRGDWDEVIQRVRMELEAALVSGTISRNHRGLRALSQDPDPAKRPIHVSEPKARPGFGAIAETAAGILQYAPLDTLEGQSIRWYGEYLQEQVNFLLRFIGRGQVVVEVGAGVGCHALWIARAVGNEGHVFLYERGAAAQHVLRHNVAANRLPGITVMSRALGAHADLQPASVGDSETPAAAQVDSARRRIETLDDLQLERLDWLKVNKGVSSAAVLEGAVETIWRLRPRLFVAASNEAELAGLAARIREFSYRCWRKETPLYNPANFYGRATDMFDGRKALAILAIPEEVEIAAALEGCFEIT